MISKRQIKLLQSLKNKKNRCKERLFIAEGEKTVMGLIDNRLTPKSIYVIEKKIGSAYLEPLKKVQLIQKINEKMMACITHLNTPSSIFGVFQIPNTEELKSKPKGIYLALWEIRDPGNMGTILRTSEWFDVTGIICSANCVDIYNPKTVQASMGSLGKIPIIYTSHFEQFITKHHSMNIYATDLGEDSIYVDEITRYRKKQNESICLVLGSESHGLPKNVLNLCENKVKIPRGAKSHTESLNIAVAAGIMLRDIYSKD